MATITIRHFVERAGAFYYQATPAMRRGGIHSEALGADRHPAILRAEALNDEWDAIRKGGKTKARAVTFDWLILKYEHSSGYAVLKPKTVLEVDQCTKIIGSILGGSSVRSLRRSRILEIHDQIFAQGSLPLANKVIRRLSVLLNFAVERQFRPDNPAQNLNLPKLPPRKQRWTTEQVRAVIDKALDMGLPGWARGIAIGYDTSQRLSDIVGALWSAYDGEGIEFKQAKTGVEMWVPLWSDTIEMLNQTNRTAVTIITGERGRPINEPGYFGKRFRVICQAAGIPDELQFRDLRRTAATEVSAGGGNVASLTGHVEGSPMAKVYVIKTKDSARAAQAARKRVRNKSV
jgi:integrase